MATIAHAACTAPVADPRRRRWSVAPAGSSGACDDLVVRLGDSGYPPVTAVLARVASRDVFISGDAVAELEHGRIVARDRPPRPAPVRAPSAGSAAAQGRARPAADRRRRRAAAAGERHRAGAHRGLVAGGRGRRRAARDPAPRRAAPRRLPQIGEGQVLDWAEVEPFTGHVPTVRCGCRIRS